MNNRVYKINANKLPDDVSQWKWESVKTDLWEELPQIACVFVVVKVEDGVIIPLQAASSENLRGYFYKGNLKVRAHNRNEEVHYIRESNEVTRRKMKLRLDEVFGLKYVY